MGMVGAVGLGAPGMVRGEVGGMQREEVREQVRRWAKDGLITADQAEKLVASLPAAAPDAAGPIPTQVLARVLLVCAALNGLALFGFSRLNGVEAPAHALVLLWMLSVAPLAYLLRQAVFAVLLALLWFAWVGLFVHGSLPMVDAILRLPFLPVTYLAAGVALFAWGGLHYLHPPLAPVARVFRLAGLQASLAGLFALGMETFSAQATGMTDWRSAEASDRFVLGLLALCLAAAVPTVVNIRLARRLPALTTTEGPISLALVAGVVLYTVLPLPTIVYMVIWNAVLFALIGAVIARGWRQGDLRLVQIAGAALALCLVARYVGLTWKRLPMGTMVLGLLVVAAVAAGILAWLLRGAPGTPAEEAASGPAEVAAPALEAQAAPTAAPTLVEPAPAKPAKAEAKLEARQTELAARTEAKLEAKREESAPPPPPDDDDLDPDIRALLAEARGKKSR